MNYDTLATSEQISKTIAALAEHNITAEAVTTGAEALEKIKGMIPQGASVMNGTSTTLEQIGYIEYLKGGTHGWNNVHAGILAEEDPAKQAVLRKQAVISDYYLGSVHALSETGEFLIASNTGSQLPHVVYTSQNLIFVVGAQKIVPNLAEAFKRLDERVVPLEDDRIMKMYGVHTFLSKILIFKGENPRSARKLHMLIVNEKLGY